MKLEEQVVSLELAKKLKELGVKQESIFYWIYESWRKPNNGFVLYRPDETQDGERLGVSAFSVAELGEMLPYGYYSSKTSGLCIEYGKFFCKSTHKINVHYADTEADARAKCLIYLIENGIVKP